MSSIPMRLPCEKCGELHVDEGEFATKDHHTHQCEKCGLVWRPAIENTRGVRFLWEQSKPKPDACLGCGNPNCFNVCCWPGNKFREKKISG